MNKSERTKQIFMVLVPVVAWTGFALSHALVARQEEERNQRFLEDTRERMIDQARDFEKLKHMFDCNSPLVMGMCMDPPCSDSDASDGLASQYVRGSVMLYSQAARLRKTIDDTCADANVLHEATCKPESDGGVIAAAEWLVFRCEKGCVDGACVR